MPWKTLGVALVAFVGGIAALVVSVVLSYGLVELLDLVI